MARALSPDSKPVMKSDLAGAAAHEPGPRPEQSAYVGFHCATGDSRTIGRQPIDPSTRSLLVARVDVLPLARCALGLLDASKNVVNRSLTHACRVTISLPYAPSAPARSRAAKTWRTVPVKPMLTIHQPSAPSVLGLRVSWRRRRPAASGFFFLAALPPSRGHVCGRRARPSDRTSLCLPDAADRGWTICRIPRPLFPHRSGRASAVAYRGSVRRSVPNGALRPRLADALRCADRPEGRSDAGCHADPRREQRASSRREYRTRRLRNAAPGRQARWCQRPDTARSARPGVPSMSWVVRRRACGASSGSAATLRCSSALAS